MPIVLKQTIDTSDKFLEYCGVGLVHRETVKKLGIKLNSSGSYLRFLDHTEKEVLGKVELSSVSYGNIITGKIKPTDNLGVRVQLCVNAVLEEAIQSYKLDVKSGKISLEQYNKLFKEIESSGILDFLKENVLEDKTDIIEKQVSGIVYGVDLSKGKDFTSTQEIGNFSYKIKDTSVKNILENNAKIFPCEKDINIYMLDNVDEVIKTSQTVKLNGANILFQPVQGTSSNSRYFMAGCSRGVKIGVRWNGSSMSIRFEAKDLNLFSKIFKDNKIDIKDGYASVHVDNVISPKTANSAFYSFLINLDMPLETPMIDFKLIHNKGA